MMKPLVVLTGPTAVGKTSLSIGLAERIGGEIISADSVQVYRGMNIGSAKILPEEMQGVPHHLIDVLDPREDFNVTVFQKLCLEAMDKIYAKGKIPILVGGTGFYIQAVLYGIDFSENPENTEIRCEYERLAEEKGPEYLHALLQEKDPKSAEIIHANNIKRTIRALEFFDMTGKPISEHNETERKKDSPYNAFYFVLNDDREKLYTKIEARVDKMIEDGLVEEVRGLLNQGCKPEMVSMQGIGYKEIVGYLQGEYSLEEAVNRMKLNTRHFAKRQLTWFRRERDVIWIEKPEFAYDDKKILDYMIKIMRSLEE